MYFCYIMRRMKEKHDVLRKYFKNIFTEKDFYYTFIIMFIIMFIMLTLTAFAWMCCVEMVIHWQFQAKRIVLVMEYCEGGSLYHMLDQPQYQFGLPEDLFLLVLFHVGRLTKKLFGEGFDFQPLTHHPTTTFGLLPCSTVFDNVIYCSLISGLYCHLLLAFLEDSESDVIKCLLNIVFTFHLLRAPCCLAPIQQTLAALGSFLVLDVLFFLYVWHLFVLL